jgi:hypothetical protein
MSIAYKVQDEQGWTDQTLLELALEYIDNQKCDDVFKDYLEEHGAPPDEDAPRDQTRLACLVFLDNGTYAQVEDGVELMIVHDTDEMQEWRDNDPKLTTFDVACPNTDHERIGMRDLLDRYAHLAGVKYRWAR